MSDRQGLLCRLLVSDVFVAFYHCGKSVPLVIDVPEVAYQTAVQTMSKLMDEKSAVSWTVKRCFYSIVWKHLGAAELAEQADTDIPNPDYDEEFVQFVALEVLAKLMDEEPQLARRIHDCYWSTIVDRVLSMKSAPPLHPAERLAQQLAVQ